jgi:large subunit ribosomal protein L6
MSRIGKLPIEIADKVSVELKDGVFTAKGPKGSLSFDVHPEMVVEINEKQVEIKRPSDHRRHRSLHGMTRSILASVVTGVSEGFTRALEIQGVGYRANMEGNTLVMSLGFSHPVRFDKPADVAFEISKDQRTVTVSGIDKQRVGQVAAKIRDFKPPEPYKGTGVRYVGEHVRRKEGKAGA